MNNLWITYFEMYPNTEIQDFIKFLYQSVLGSGHLINDVEENYRRLENEYQALTYDSNHILYEQISDQLVRVHLEAIPKEDLRMMHRLFMRSMDVSNSKEELLNIFDLVTQGINQGFIPFKKEEWLTEVQKYIEKGCPVLSHSERFREEYHPHYRLMKKAYIEVIPLFKRIEMLEEKGVISIDGHSGSGKSTLASLIHEVYGFPIIHMDDFFLQPYQRTPKRLEEIGGNVDYERFNEEVVFSLNQRISFDYQIFDCTTMTIHGSKKIDFKDKVIVEGSYSHHPYFKDYASLKIFLDIEPDLQRERILKRNGEKMLERFVKEWIPKENAYFERFDIKEKADIRVKRVD